MLLSKPVGAGEDQITIDRLAGMTKVRQRQLIRFQGSKQVLGIGKYRIGARISGDALRMFPQSGFGIFNGRGVGV